ncbi:MAG: hypothetical protein AAFV95_05655 [Bacteroidota bacterium]
MSEHPLPNADEESGGRRVELPSFSLFSYLLPVLLLGIALLLGWFVLRPASQKQNNEKLIRMHWVDKLKNSDLQLLANPASIQRINPELTKMEGAFFEQVGKLQMADPSQSTELLSYFRSLGQSQQQPIAYYLLAHTHFLEGDYPKAIRFFKQYQQDLSPNGSVFEDSEYFLLLSYLANNSAPLISEPLLQSIVDRPQHRFNNAAKTLQQSLEKK